LENEEKSFMRGLPASSNTRRAANRWALMGIPQAAIMAAAGHHSIPQNLTYTNLQPDDVKNAFQMATGWQQELTLENASAASY
jgi:hypothetical protein